MTVISAKFSLCVAPCFTKYQTVIKYREDKKFVFITAHKESAREVRTLA